MIETTLSTMSLGAALAIVGTVLTVVLGIVTLVKFIFDYKIQQNSSIPITSEKSSDGSVTYRQANTEFVRKEAFDLFKDQIDELRTDLKQEIKGAKDNQQTLINQLNRLVITMGQTGFPIGKRKSDFLEEVKEIEL